MATRQLIPRAKRAGNFSRGLQARNLNIAFASISVGAYSGQLGLAVALLANTRSAALQDAFGPHYCGFILQRPWSDMDGYRDNPAGIRSRRATGSGVSMEQPPPSSHSRAGYRNGPRSPPGSTPPNALSPTMTPLSGTRQFGKPPRSSRRPTARSRVADWHREPGTVDLLDCLRKRGHHPGEPTSRECRGHRRRFLPHAPGQVKGGTTLNKTRSTRGVGTLTATSGDHKLGR